MSLKKNRNADRVRPGFHRGPEFHLADGRLDEGRARAVVPGPVERDPCRPAEHPGSEVLSQGGGQSGGLETGSAGTRGERPSRPCGSECRAEGPPPKPDRPDRHFDGNGAVFLPHNGKPGAFGARIDCRKDPGRAWGCSASMQNRWPKTFGDYE